MLLTLTVSQARHFTKAACCRNSSRFPKRLHHTIASAAALLPSHTCRCCTVPVRTYEVHDACSHAELPQQRRCLGRANPGVLSL